MFRSFLPLSFLLFAVVASVDAGAAEPQVIWPQGWKVESLSADALGTGHPPAACDQERPFR